MSALNKIKSAIHPTIKEGAPFNPKVELKENDPHTANVSLQNPTQGTIIVLGVPGAFSPTCSNQVPGYIEHAEQLRAKGVETVYVVAVNDVFVTKAWAEKLGADKTNGFVRVLSDDTGKFTSSLGLDFDATALLGSHRPKRFAAVVHQGIVKKLVVEEDPTQVVFTGAASILTHL
ncbi:unnamed protein product [Tilletia controversa]|uniref:Thioredoxin domain-containing protein n=3 Tax=Tilletia TaxID=13289 RepID=A0A8X7SX63_9BASI|nr:hypothetical protein CF336_g4189 [Tilletia laevis]KAE8195463.1 hypothetical protein CF328_g4427 [Tilletia controversa]KAE8261105.1 hypothetical protein A4X03_0g3537 [Tilletia caries]KAE8199936.1 hypothetical protein CF335_g4055 [Tilletia laevis]KAE8248180.1 hypothetical protein A4X06_0g3900 [Tilletia controversa]